VLKFRSVNNIVIAPASTGNDKSNRITVIRTDHTNNEVDSILVDVDFMLIIVVIKLIAPKIEDTPARCSLKIVMSTEDLEWDK
jgi:hypothetical protein